MAILILGIFLSVSFFVRRISS